MSLTYTVLCFVAATLISACTHDNRGATDVQATASTVCQLVRESARFNGKVVRVRGAVSSDGMHWTLLVDSQCELGIVLRSSEDVVKHPERHADIESFQSALATGTRGTLDKHVSGNFTGRFIWTPTSDHEPRVLQLQSISDLVVTPIRKSDSR